MRNVTIEWHKRTSERQNRRYEKREEREGIRIHCWLAWRIARLAAFSRNSARSCSTSACSARIDMLNVSSVVLNLQEEGERRGGRGGINKRRIDDDHLMCHMQEGKGRKRIILFLR